MYNKITNDDIKRLCEIVGNENVIIGADISPDYSHDELGTIENKPDCVVKVEATQQISQIMSLAWERVIPVTVRGSGTGLVGAAVPVCGGILLETTKMNKILSLDKNTLTVTVQPVTLPSPPP